ncbi:hypothetical protein HDU85_000723 [Gaertneriomyces sp. JEL0708]|nr:hypothetical protein HDU85_000723 [Gaertneriomyces sp. JEL0708]
MSESDSGPMPSTKRLHEDDQDLDPVASKRVRSDEVGNGAVANAEDDDDDDEDIGPMPAPEVQKKPKKRRVLPHESLYLSKLPDKPTYERSLMHRDVINFVVVTKTGFILTTSLDGHLKFWHKTAAGLDFVKHFRAHLGAIVAIDVTADGQFAVTGGVDAGVKVFDVAAFDMITMFKYASPVAESGIGTVGWAWGGGVGRGLVCVTDRTTPDISIYSHLDGQLLRKIRPPHTAPISVLRYNPMTDVVVSVDKEGGCEYWAVDTEALDRNPEDGDTPHATTGDANTQKGWLVPGRERGVHWDYKSDTDLWIFRKNKKPPASLTFSPDYTRFATISLQDRHVRVFHFATGKLYRDYDEGLAVVMEMQQKGGQGKLDDMEFGRRVAVERELESQKGGQSTTINAVFDGSSNFLIYPTILGIKVVNLVTNRVVRLLGKPETQRYLHLALYQGVPRKKRVVTIEMAASTNEGLREAEKEDPTIYCTGWKRNRFYCFSTREASESDTQTSRDIFNEKPSLAEQTVAKSHQTVQNAAKSVVIHTTYGDIHLHLLPQYAPKTVENFLGLAKKGYYDNLIFHRVIKGFMIQTGCPFGDGTGGDSLWGGNFEDEFAVTQGVKHDRPYTLSMANIGPNTNGSQFFITTVPAPWLDNKHTVFGRATGGMDVIQRIESVKVDKSDKPAEDVRILSVEIRG